MLIYCIWIQSKIILCPRGIMVLQNYEEGFYEATSKSNDFTHRPLKYYQDLKLDLSYVCFIILIILSLYCIVSLYRFQSDTSRNKLVRRVHLYHISLKYDYWYNILNTRIA